MKTEKIISHYNDLKKRAEAARFAAKNPKGYIEEICALATELAKRDRMAFASRLAERGEEIPQLVKFFRYASVLGFGLSFEWARYGLASVDKGPTPDYTIEAEAQLAPEFERRAAEAERRFEVYRRAVEQGVAIAPEAEE